MEGEREAETRAGKEGETRERQGKREEEELKGALTRETSLPRR